MQPEIFKTVKGFTLNNEVIDIEERLKYHLYTDTSKCIYGGILI